MSFKRGNNTKNNGQIFMQLVVLSRTWPKNDKSFWRDLGLIWILILILD